MDAGLCATCRHVRKLANDRGSVFYRCTLAERDKRFRPYPPLPVRQCEGYEKGPRDNFDGDAEALAPAVRGPT